MSPRSLLHLALCLLPAGFASAQASVFQGTPGSTGDVVVYPGPGAAKTRPPELQGIVLLPVDAVGRSTFTQFQPDQPRLKTDVPLASRIALPGQQGSLYRYRRPLSGGDEFGYFLVGPDGLANFLAAFPGTGPNGLQDPIPDPVALASAGDSMLVATTLAAGGDVFEIELQTGAVHALTTDLPPLEVRPQGLALLPNWGAVLTSTGPRRFTRGGGTLRKVALWSKAATASFGRNPGAPLPPALTYLGTGFACSADGGTLALVAGTSATQAHVFSFQLAGPSVCVNDVPAPIVSSGTGSQAGPFLALSANGRRAAWKTEDNLGGECFSREVSSAPTVPEFQITADANFTDTLNDTGVISFFDPDSVIVLVGEPNGVGGIEKGDFYRARFGVGGGAPSFENLSMTSNDGVAPFLEKGEIETTDGLYQIPGQAGCLYFVPGSSGQGIVYRLDAATGTVDMIRSGVEHVDFVERAGAHFVVEVLHDSPVQRELVRVPFDHALPATSLGFFPGAETFTSATGNQAGLFTALLNQLGGQRLLQLDVPASSGALLPGQYVLGSALGFDGNGAVLASMRSATQAFFFSWSLDGSLSGVYGAGPAQSIVLPGL